MKSLIDPFKIITMSSGQWEVVGKSKKAPNGKVNVPKEDEKKPVKNGPKAAEAPKPKIFYAGMEIDLGEDEKKPVNKKKEAAAKKKQAAKEAAKPQPPKNLREALEMLDAAELATLITTNKLRFSNAPLVWLKEVASYLNSKLQIDIEDPTFPNHPPNYPASSLPEEIKYSLEGLLKDVGKANAHVFYDITLTALANDMNKGQSVNGHRVLLQMIAQGNPEFCTSSLQKMAILRTSYQNRPPIGLSLLWAYGQGGVVDFIVGMTAWQELFVPLIELKNYSKYTVQYLSKLLDRHAKSPNVKISQEQLVAMFDLVYAKRNTLPKDVASDLILQLSKYKDIYFSKSGNKLQVLFNQLMKKLPNQYLSGPSLDPHSRVLVESLIDCLQRDDSCNATWRQLFNKCSKQSATVIHYIDTNWSEVSSRLKLKSLNGTILLYQDVSKDTLKGKKKDETVIRTHQICQDIMGKMKSKKGRGFPWFWASMFLVASIAGAITYDSYSVNWNFPKSATGKLFKDLGILEPTQKAWQKTLSTSARGYIWLETNTPIYYTNTIEFVKPYAQLSKDVAIIAYKKTGVLYDNVKEYIVEKTPVVVATIEQYAPGLVDNVSSYTAAGYGAVKKYSYNYFVTTTDFFKTKVFVGEWAPEVLQNKTQTALNVTRTHVSTYFNWLRQQVHVYSEIP